jgi:hypothetical protein
MRDLTKSMMDCVLAISVFGVHQMTSLFAGNAQSPAKQVADAFDRLTHAATQTFDDSAQAFYRAGASVQNAVIDVLLGGAMFVTRKEPAQEAGEPTPITDLDASGSAADSSR